MLLDGGGKLCQYEFVGLLENLPSPFLLSLSSLRTVSRPCLTQFLFRRTVMDCFNAGKPSFCVLWQFQSVTLETGVPLCVKVK